MPSYHSISKVITSVSKKEFSVSMDPQLPPDIKGKTCPVSGTTGLRVTINTLRNHVQEKYWDIIEKDDYFFCPNHDCEIVYFNNIEQLLFTTSEVRTRVGHKNGPEPRPICYCLNVLEHRILDEIVVKRCCTSLADIQKFTRARTGRLCHITNPSGRCCGPQVNETISKGIRLANGNKELQKAILEEVHSGCEFCQHEIEYLSQSFNVLTEACRTCGTEWTPTGTSKGPQKR